MPNLVNRLTVEEFSREVRHMGSCLIVSFDRMTVAQAAELRHRFRQENVRLRVVKNRLASLALGNGGVQVPRLMGKCGVVFAQEEKAITAAKLVRKFATENRDMSIEVLAGVLEGEVITGEEARRIADMPDKDTVRSQLASAIIGPARCLASVIGALPRGLARCLQERVEAEEPA